MKGARFGLLSPLMFGARKSGPVIVNPVIDFMAAILDGRVNFVAPAHSYINSSGELAQSVANVWPIEYRNGVAVGRHEPERASQNYLPSTQFESMGATGSPDWFYSTGSTVTTESSDLGVTAAIANVNSIYAALYNETAGSFIVSQYDAGSPATWQSVISKVNNPSASLLRWYTARASSTLYLYGKTAQVPAGNIVASFMRRKRTNSMDTVGGQVEPGTNRTSLIVNGQGQTRSRAAMVATINDPLAVGATVLFNNGESLELTPSNGVITIPVTTQDWRTRFITQITLR